MLRRFLASGWTAAGQTTATPFARPFSSLRQQTAAVLPSRQDPLPDKLFSKIELEYRGHDKAVLKSYTEFLEEHIDFIRSVIQRRRGFLFQETCKHLEIRRGIVQVLPYVRWVQPLLRSKFVHKKYKVHYETRTHITRFEVHNLTGSTASTFLEYIERNIPEGIGMRVEYEELRPLPVTIAAASQR